ncbi:hypothetical protein [Flavobacterium soyangense]|uniref:Uncharacterized protein n=1 Tax=Flavobacterium soyangense TaxID=2023265 RepID=A0A930UC82_9FLAO|nr:hypothetical protein [Flavobacterium soyangense]MBF2708089.1 hypothetical protein [Flavobacterium soyangense]
MNHFSKQDRNQKITMLLMVFAFVLVSNVKAFAQTAVEYNNTISSATIASTSTDMNSIKQETVSNASNMNFVLWFMGSKQDPNVKVLPAGENTKKQFMTSGMAPNRLLIKAFLKKAVNFESAVA